MGIRDDDVRGDPRQSMHRQLPLCIILKVTEAGGFVAHHLEAIQRLTDRTGLTLDLARANGECTLVLPLHYCAVRAQALTDRLNSLTDEKGRNVLEAEVCARSAGAKSSRMAGVTPQPAATGS